MWICTCMHMRMSVTHCKRYTSTMHHNKIACANVHVCVWTRVCVCVCVGTCMCFCNGYSSVFLIDEYVIIDKYGEWLIQANTVGRSFYNAPQIKGLSKTLVFKSAFRCVASEIGSVCKEICVL